MASNISDVKKQMNQLSQQLLSFRKTKHFNIELDLTFNSLNVNSVLSQTTNTLIDYNLIQQINDLNIIKDCGIDLTNRYSDNSNENNVSIVCQISDESLGEWTQRHRLPEVIDSDNDSEEDIKSDVNSDYQPKEEIISGSVDENEDSIDRQEYEDKSVSNGSQRETELNTNEDNDRQTEDKTSDEEVADKSDNDCRQRVKRVKTSKDRYRCDYKDCGKSYCHKQDLRRHQLSHSGKRYYCDHKKCVKHFAHSSDLNKHKKSGRHVLGQSFKCGRNACDYQTKHMDQLDKDQLETHIASHPIKRHDKTIDGKYECDFIGCHKKFNSYENMCQHKHIHLNRIYRCDMNGCDQTFATPIYLRRHQTNQHITKYRCDRDGCEYKSGVKWQFNLHLKNHLNERQFKCLINNCHKSFKLKSDLTGHQLAVHPNDLPDIPWIECIYNGCQYKTKFNRNMTRHTKSHSK